MTTGTDGGGDRAQLTDRRQRRIPPGLKGWLRLRMLRFLPLRDMWPLSGGALVQDIGIGLVVAILAVPQAVAYAVLAGLPPAMGLYAAVVPVIVGALFRSSRHVISGPSNAVSLLVGTAVAGLAGEGDPVQLALTLALMVGIIQMTAGFLNLGALVDYISSPVVLGYITGAGVLIGVGQLPSVTGTEGGGDDLFRSLMSWAVNLGQTDLRTVGISLATVAVLLGLRRFAPQVPGALVVMAGGIGASGAFGFQENGIAIVRDLAPIPPGFPPLGLPSLGEATSLLPMAMAITVLSLVESTSVARSLAKESGQRLDPSVEFWGQGLANVAAGFTGGYPVSGSLARSGLAQRMGSSTRFTGVFAGLGVLAVLLVAAPLVDLTPVAVLAGLLLVVAVDLVDITEIRNVFRSRPSDGMAFVATLGGTFLLPLDQAIYLGVAISIAMYLRRARMLVVRELGVAPDGMLREGLMGVESLGRCPRIRILHLEGSLFFAAANELRALLDRVAAEPGIEVLVVRLKRARGLDYTAATVLQEVHAKLARDGVHLVLVGVRPDMVDVLRRVGAAEEFGEDLFPTRPGWFVATHAAVEYAHGLVSEHPSPCALDTWLREGPMIAPDLDPDE